MRYLPKDIKHTLLNISILEKLLDDNASQISQEFRQSTIDITMIIESVKNNLENLLNTRSLIFTNKYQWPILEKSLINYGVKDFSNVNLANHNICAQFCSEVESRIRIFEPRLKKVTVQIMSFNESSDHVLRLRIQGVLPFAYGEELITLDSMLNPEKNDFVII